MAKKKACKLCKMFVEGNECPTCKTSDFSTNWQGRIFVVDTENSKIAKTIGAKINGEYAIKVK